MAKLKNAPFANKQPTGKAYEAQIIAGADAWNKTRWQTVKEWTRAESDYQPIILGGEQLQELKAGGLKVAVDVGLVSIYQSGELKEAEKSAIIANLAKYSTACNVAFYDEACQMVENASEYLSRLRAESEKELMTGADSVLLS